MALAYLYRVEAEQASLQTLTKGLSVLEAQESAAAEQARIADLTARFRAGVARFIEAIESGNDALAPYRISQVEGVLGWGALPAVSSQAPARRNSLFGMHR